MTALQAVGISMTFGGVHALSNVSFAVEKGEIFSLVGPNGAGKTTMFNVISGLYRPSTGDIRRTGQSVLGLTPHQLALGGLSRTFQNLQIFFRMTALENVMVGCHKQESRNVLAHLLHLRSARADNAASREKSMRLLDEAGLAAYADMPSGSLPYGALKRLEIARALATEPEVLLLDEPAAGCNGTETEEVERLIGGIAATGKTIILVEHDMKMVMRLSHRIHVLNQGRTIAEGTPAYVSSHPDVIEAYLGHDSEHAAATAETGHA